jgi:hypothetical protein
MKKSAVNSYVRARWQVKREHSTARLVLCRGIAEHLLRCRSVRSLLAEPPFLRARLRLALRHLYLECSHFVLKDRAVCARALGSLVRRRKRGLCGVALCLRGVCGALRRRCAGSGVAQQILLLRHHLLEMRDALPLVSDLQARCGPLHHRMSE